MSTLIDWSKYPNFSEDEFKCSHCGEVYMNPEFLDKLQELRTLYGKPLFILSGYRCPEHPIEAKKKRPGTHTKGIAVDIAISGRNAYKLLKLAFKLGFTGVGVRQKGDNRFIHLDISQDFPRPNVWSY